MKSRYAFAIIKKTDPKIKLLDIYPTKDVSIEDDEYWQPIEIKPVKVIPKGLYGFNKRQN